MGYKPKYVYVASSWKNEVQPRVVDALRENGIECYDFKRDEGAGFSWSEVDATYKLDWDGNPARYFHMIDQPRAIEGYQSDFDAMCKADMCILVHPAGRSAHIEAGWMKGSGRKLAIFFPGYVDEPDLMYRMADYMTDSLAELLEWMGVQV